MLVYIFFYIEVLIFRLSTWGPKGVRVTKISLGAFWHIHRNKKTSEFRHMHAPVKGESNMWIEDIMIS